MLTLMDGGGRPKTLKHFSNWPEVIVLNAACSLQAVNELCIPILTLQPN